MLIKKDKWKQSSGVSKKEFGEKTGRDPQPRTRVRGKQFRTMQREVQPAYKKLATDRAEVKRKVIAAKNKIIEAENKKIIAKQDKILDELEKAQKEKAKKTTKKSSKK